MNYNKQRSGPTKEDLAKLSMLRVVAHSTYGITEDTIKTSSASEKYREEYKRLLRKRAQSNACGGGGRNE